MLLRKQFYIVLLASAFGGTLVLSVSIPLEPAHQAWSAPLPAPKSPCPPPAPTPIPTPPDCAPAPPTADICLSLATDPGGAVPPAAIATYQLVARNSGRGDASDVRITLPFAADAQTPLDAMFSTPTGWVSAVLTETVELRLGALKRAQTITATLRLRISPAAQLGRDLATRALFHWSARHSSGSGLSNHAPLIVAEQAAEQRLAALAITLASGPPTTTFAITYDGFASNEHVSMWYQGPDGGNVGLGDVRADPQGRATYHLMAATLPTGRYNVSASGQCSQIAAVGTFVIDQ